MPRVTLAQLAEEKGVSYLLDEVGQINIGLLLNEHTPSKALKKILRAQATLEELRTLEKKANEKLLLEAFETGDWQIRGKDVEGRPILWARQPTKSYRIRPPYTEYILRDIWMLTLVYRMRANEEMSFIRMIDDFNRGRLDFNLPMAKEFLRYSDGLTMTKRPDMANYLITKSKTLAVCSNFVKESCRVGVNLNCFYRPQEVLPFLQDPSNYPDWWLPGGRPFRMSFDTVGNWRDLVIRKSAFEELSLRDIFVPEVHRFDEIRARAEAEEMQIHLDAAVSLNSTNGSEANEASSGGSCAGSRNEFLM